ncbi:MAG: hypothetical protein AAFX79_13565 [Planctomycetota bacterium]
MAEPPDTPEPVESYLLASGLQDQVLKAWDIYIKFYTVFLTVNFVAIGVVLEKVTTPFATWLLAIAFIVQNGVSLGTAIGMIVYSKAVFGRQDQLGHAQLPAFQKLARWGGLGNAISHGVLIVLWVITLVYAVIDGGEQGGDASFSAPILGFVDGPQAGASVTVRYRRDVLGQSSDLPGSWLADAHNGAVLSVSGTLHGIGGGWIAIDRRPRAGTTGTDRVWVPLSMVIAIDQAVAPVMSADS